MSTLFLVSTPIGNLEDMSPRAVRVLSEVSLIACEDTRHSGKLLHHFNINTPTTSYFEHTRGRPDRAAIRDEWIEFVIENAVREQQQSDGRIRRWAKIEDAEGRFLRVVLLEDGETVHNAFFDRRFREAKT